MTALKNILVNPDCKNYLFSKDVKVLKLNDISSRMVSAFQQKKVFQPYVVKLVINICIYYCSGDTLFKIYFVCSLFYLFLL